MKVAIKKDKQENPLQSGVDCTPECPVKLAADILSGKWTTLIVRELLPGTRRYSQLQHGLLGISPKNSGKSSANAGSKWLGQS